MDLKLIREKELREQKLGGISRSTFFRRYRHHENAPKPVDTPDGTLAWWSHEWDAFLASLEYTDDPRENLEPLPAHWMHGGERNGPDRRKHRREAA